jgi:hypothetical protein
MLNNDWFGNEKRLVLRRKNANLDAYFIEKIPPQYFLLFFRPIILNATESPLLTPLPQDKQAKQNIGTAIFH